MLFHCLRTDSFRFNPHLLLRRPIQSRRAADVGLLPVLCRIADKTRKRIKPILISERRWDAFRQSVGLVEFLHGTDHPPPG